MNPSTSSQNTPTSLIGSTNQSAPSSLSAPASTSTSTSQSESTSQSAIGFDENDISFFIKQKRTDNEKQRLLRNRWMPDDKFKFPPSGKRNLRFKKSWLIQYSWLCYSQKEDGAYCQYCALFCSEQIGKNSNVRASSLVIAPFKNWKGALEKFKSHEGLQYHTNC